MRRRWRDERAGLAAGVVQWLIISPGRVTEPPVVLELRAALKRGLAEFLSTHPLVEKLHAEAEDRGGNAITVAELKS